MLDRDRVSPRNVVRRNAQRNRQAFALQRTGCVIAAHDGFNQFRIQSRGAGELVNADSGHFHVVCDRFHYDAILSLFESAGRRKKPAVVSLNFSESCFGPSAPCYFRVKPLLGHIGKTLGDEAGSISSNVFGPGSKRGCPHGGRSFRGWLGDARPPCRELHLPLLLFFRLPARPEAYRFRPGLAGDKPARYSACQVTHFKMDPAILPRNAGLVRRIRERTPG